MFITDDDLKSLRERNELRAQAAKEAMGTKWVCHKVNAPKRVKKKKLYTK